MNDSARGVWRALNGLVWTVSILIFVVRCVYVCMFGYFSGLGNTRTRTHALTHARARAHRERERDTRARVLAPLEIEEWRFISADKKTQTNKHAKTDKDIQRLLCLPMSTDLTSA